MEFQTITFFDPESETSVEVNVAPEDAVRAQNDIVFATTLMNKALNSNPTVCSELENSGEEESTVYRWNDNCVKLLLESYRVREDDLNTGRISHKKFWDEISKTLNEKGHHVSGSQCASKMRSLKKSYKSVRDSNKKSGNNKRSWQYYDIMDEIFSKKAWCNPVATLSSTGLEEQNAADTNTACKSGSKNSVVSLLAKRLKQKEEQEKEKERRHTERLEMDKKMLSVLEQLVAKDTS